MTYAIHGYTIVSADDRIADASGRMPDTLKFETDWVYFQSELDLCTLILLGRASHEVAPNPRGRRRLVISGRVRGLEVRPDATWWNPADLALADALARLLPQGGRIGVPGGQGAFDLVRAGPGFDAFHLARAPGVTLPGGRGLFSACENGVRAETILAQAGLTAGPARMLEPGADLTVWRR